MEPSFVKYFKKYMPILIVLICIIAYAVNACDSKDALIGLAVFFGIVSEATKLFFPGK